MDIQPGAVEGMVMHGPFWHGKRVLITGHTGFKGSWLALWLQKLGALVAGYALPPPPGQSLFELAAVTRGIDSTLADIRDTQSLYAAFERFRPEVVFHLAAQPLVRLSYQQPLETYQVNVLGTANLLEAVRRSRYCRAVVCISSDKCYDNKEWVWGYRESDRLGGRDPYSSSKACAELVISAYRDSFFARPDAGSAGIASARAGNVIGGGDFSRDRLIPDALAAMHSGEPLTIRSPAAIRPWQHVLEPLSGYMLLAERLWEEPEAYAQAWNFGPAPEDARTVLWIVKRLSECAGGGLSWNIDSDSSFHEASALTLDSSKAQARLGWKPRWTLDQALSAVVSWDRAHCSREPLRDLMLRQIASYEGMSSSPAGSDRTKPKRKSAHALSPL